jgi:hypothetical protein
VVLSSAPWSQELRDERFARGPHQSANEHLEFLGTEFLDFCQKGYWMVMPYEDIRDHPSLRVSPLGVVPQRDRRPRIIVDYSFYDINKDTLKMAPEQSMQFGKAIERLMQGLTRANPKFGDNNLYKVDISDGFYRVPLALSSILKLGVALPTFPGMPPLIAFPLVLPMGWTESPPFFCAFTETICDLTNEALRKHQRFPAHHLEERAGREDFQPNTELGRDPFPQRPISVSHKRRLYEQPMALMDVFVDDFCGIGQQSTQNPLRNQRRALLHSIDRVFRPSDSGDAPDRKEPISVSKLDKGDAAWQDQKRCLGWDFGGRSKTLLIPAHRRTKARTTIQTMLSRKRSGLKDWQSMLGDLRSLVPGLPGSKGQFSLLQAALAPLDGQHRVRLRDATKEQLRTFETLLAQPARPAYAEELISGDPSFIGACDAAKPGMGGVWFDNTDGNRAPVVWRCPFPVDVQKDLVSQGNPHGRITNSDLELAGTLAQQAVLQSQYPLCGQTTHTFCDNTPSVAWRTKGSTTTTKSAAYLLSWSALHQREHGYQANVEYLEGPKNQMADDASRLWQKDDNALLTHFNSRYPQTSSWRICPLPQQTSSALISRLTPEKWPMVSSPLAPAAHAPIGTSGQTSVSPSSWTQASPSSLTPSPSSWSSQGESKMAASQPVETRSALDQQRTPYVRWARRFPHWATTIRGKARRANLISA